MKLKPVGIQTIIISIALIVGIVVGTLGIGNALAYDGSLSLNATSGTIQITNKQLDCRGQRFEHTHPRIQVTP